MLCGEIVERSERKEQVHFVECPSGGHYMLYARDSTYPQLFDWVRCKGCGRDFEVIGIELGVADSRDVAVGLSYELPRKDDPTLYRVT